MHAPAADVAEQVEYALAFYIRCKTGAVHAVVVEPAGFLAFDHGRFKLHAVLFQCDPLRHNAEYAVDIALKAFGVACSRIVLEQDASRFEHLNQRGNHVVLVALHGGGGQLHDQNVEETVYNQARQQVGVTVNQAIARLVEQAVTQARGHIDAVNQQ